MKFCIFICASTVLLQHLNHIQAKEKLIDVAKVVEAVNKATYLPWKADTYGESNMNSTLFAQTKLGVIMKENEISLKKQSPRSLIKKATLKNPNLDGIGLPINFTWASEDTTSCPISHIRDQSNCGSCWAVSTAAAFGDRVCLQSQGKMKTPLSQEFVTACDKSNRGCSGGYMYNVNNFIMFNGTITGGDYDSDDGCQQYSIRPCGFPRSSSMPCGFDSSLNPKCKLRKCNNDWYSYKEEPDSNVYKAKNWFFINANSTLSREDRIRDEIYRNGPVTAAFYVLQDFMFYKKGVYVPSPRAWYAGGHAVRVVGWGVENGLKYWHAANSWSSTWGEEGFFKIIRGVNACAFESQMTAFVVNTSSQ